MRLRLNNSRELADDVEGRKRPLPWPFELAAMSLDVFFVVSKLVVMLEIVFNNAIVLELAFNDKIDFVRALRHIGNIFLPPGIYFKLRITHLTILVKFSPRLHFLSCWYH